MHSIRRRRPRRLALIGRGAALVLVVALAAVTATAIVAVLAATTDLTTDEALAAQSPAKRPNLQGTWKLNPVLTAQVSKDEQGSEGQEHREGGGKGHHRQGGDGDWGGGGMPGGGMPGDGVPAPKGGDNGAPAPGGSARPNADGSSAGSGSHDGTSGSGSARGTADRAKAEGAGIENADALGQLRIAQTGDEITITDNRGGALPLKADGSKARVTASAPGGSAQVKASWDDDGSLVVEIKPDKGRKRTLTYLVSNDGKHLYLTATSRDTGGTEHSTLIAYDRAPDPEPAPPKPQG